MWLWTSALMKGGWGLWTEGKVEAPGLDPAKSLCLRVETTFLPVLLRVL